MNLGIYLQTLADRNQLQEICDAVNNNINNGYLSDASIFYDNISHNPFDIKCGMFNSTDLWNFNGKLITTSLSTTLKALKITNNISICYYYGWEKRVNPLSLLYIIKEGVEFISKTDDDHKDFYRKTGIKTGVYPTFLDFVQNFRN